MANDEEEAHKQAHKGYESENAAFGESPTNSPFARKRLTKARARARTPSQKVQQSELLSAERERAQLIP